MTKSHSMVDNPKLYQTLECFIPAPSKDMILYMRLLITQAYDKKHNLVVVTIYLTRQTRFWRSEVNSIDDLSRCNLQPGIMRSVNEQCAEFLKMRYLTWEVKTTTTTSLTCSLPSLDKQTDHGMSEWPNCSQQVYSEKYHAPTGNRKLSTEAAAEKQGIRVKRGVQVIEKSGGRLLGLVAVIVLGRGGGRRLLPGFLLGRGNFGLHRRRGGFGALCSRLHLLLQAGRLRLPLYPTLLLSAGSAATARAIIIRVHNLFDRRHQLSRSSWVQDYISPQ